MKKFLVAALLLASSTQAFAFSRAEQTRACRPDAERLCGRFIPDVTNVTHCMNHFYSQLSPECQRMFGPRHHHRQG
ncbi:conserved hypothetical protein [Beijerinckia indica subsp. indica ATCC 9039]|uniref:Uncharacterized protein n=1 Tax=Beijerinckia indica subsp. indica (strain ATCC 9039 / DSM 1715 / NCIMB 8712) TaxID=395963 RepID=B2IF67_BEII9|nr:conserved hypothetical protein [Beijerinckia indica subsp. indica ATCC 9039]